MSIILLVSILVLTFYIVFKNFFYLAKKNLFKDQAAWSGKDINIKYNKSNEVSASKGNDNYLKVIAEESKFYLENQSRQEDD